MPRSSKEITSDSDYLMYRVILFRRVADTFKTNARQAGFQVHKQTHRAAQANIISSMCRTTCGQLPLFAGVPLSDWPARSQMHESRTGVMWQSKGLVKGSGQAEP